MKLSCFNLRFSLWQHKKHIRERDYTFMQYPYGGGGNSCRGPKNGGKEELGEEE